MSGDLGSPVDDHGDVGGKALWHGRFEGGPAAELMAYTESLSFDKRLWPDDVAGSVAHVRGLAHVAGRPCRCGPHLVRRC